MCTEEKEGEEEREAGMTAKKETEREKENGAAIAETKGSVINTSAACT